jgi:glycosyltransferase involved in cell wall biosynthesis
MTVLVVTTENSGIDKYSHEIAKRVDIQKIETRRYLSLLEAYRLARLIDRQDDIVHLPNQDFARYAIFIKKPFIVTVHDLFRMCLNFHRETILEKMFLKLDTRYLRRASHIITVSHNTKSDLIKYLKIPVDSITVIYNGIDRSVFRPYREKPLDKPYIIYAGSERPRKNLGRLFEAFALLKRDFPDLKLVKAGTYGRSKEYRKQSMQKLKSLDITWDVIFLDHIPEFELARYYSSAILLAYPSLYEGFGLPPAEAMACGCPVVTSNISSLPEVVGDAGLSLVQAMRRVLTDDKLRNEMTARGLEQAKKFSWEKTIEQTLAVYDKVA